MKVSSVHLYLMCKALWKSQSDARTSTQEVQPRVCTWQSYNMFNIVEGPQVGIYMSQGLQHHLPTGRYV